MIFVSDNFYIYNSKLQMFMKRNLLLRLCLMIVVAFSIYSCRQEFLLQDGDDAGSQSSNYKVYTIDRSQVTQDFFLFDKVAKIQTTLSEKKTGSAYRKTAQDSLMDGGNIVIDKVLVVESSGQKTYTFPLKRNYPTSKIENLVLKKNQDSTFSGKLIQYDLTLNERELFNSWHSINLKNRVKVFNIENLNL
jgi:hypothetical protein